VSCASLAAYQTTGDWSTLTYGECFTAPTFYTVSFYPLNDAAAFTQTVAAGDLLIKPADPVSSDGFDFAGWDKADGVTQWNFLTDVVTADIDLFARWIATSALADVQAASLNIYPNPARDIVTISGIGEAVTITDLQGRTIVNYDLRFTIYDGNTATINVSALTQGVYLVRVGNKTGKLIINN
jgi:hypothetical protein